MNNEASVSFKSRLSKYDSEVIMDATLIEDENNGYAVMADISNTSLQQLNIGSITADVFDSRHRLLASVPISESDIILKGEENKNLTAALPELKAEPSVVTLRSSEKSVVLDAKTNGGMSEATAISLNTEGKPSGMLPEATKNGYTFDGWFTEPKGGEMVTKDTVIEAGTTLYAQFTYTKKKQTFTVSMDNYEYDGTAPTPKISGTPYGKVITEYYDADTNTKLEGAPSDIGHYIVKVYADGNFYYFDAERTAEYRIFTNGMHSVSVKNGTFADNTTFACFEEGAVAAVTADKAEEGYKFGYWKRNGKTISYNAKYTFYVPADDVELEAVYVEDTDDIERYGNAAIESVDIDKENQKIKFVSLLNVPEDCKILKAGVVATVDEEKAKDLTIENSDYKTLYKTNITAHNYRYTLTVQNDQVLKKWYVKGYLEYEDANGNVETVSGSDTLTNEVQLLKALLPIVSTPEAIESEDNLRQS